MAKKLKLSSFSVNFDEKDKKDFSVKSNMDENTFHAAVVNWAARTIVFTAESFVDYVNSKNSGDYCEVIPEELSLVEKMKPFQEQWQKDMDKTLNPKKETLEEAAEKWYDSTEENIGYPKIKAFKDGTKWQQEKSYSEEEFKEIVYNMVGMLAQANNMTFNGAILNELFNKFKKK